MQPMLFAIIVNLVWRRVAISETYRLPTNLEFIGQEAVVMVKVDDEGGTIRVELPNQIVPLKVPAKAVHKHQEFLQDELKQELNQEKTLITHARDEKAYFLGYEIHALHADDKHDHRGQRCINGAIGLRVPKGVIDKHCAKYMQHGKPWHLMQRTIDSTYSIVAQYQAEYQGVIQYYRLAYNLHQFSRLKWAMQTSLVRTLAKKLKISTAQVYKRFKTTHRNEHGTYKVLEVRVEREAGKMPLIARFGGIPLRWNKWAAINDAPTKPIWSGRSEVVDRLLAQQCELCGATNNIEVHHIRKLADLKRYGQTNPPQWVQKMAARRRKTLVVCQDCHHAIQYGRYDGTKFSK